ncbi:hypothetical protein HMPREF9069_00255 [Atopobium sp. oral taxon 810 str. F0209]|nr:hypothetical protein HMPREF9069_00255 [Atopobium sp. oral taxon 810 str. F0209]
MMLKDCYESQLKKNSFVLVIYKFFYFSTGITNSISSYLYRYI